MKFSQRTNSELLVLVAMGVCEGAVMAIRMEAVHFGVAFMSGAVVALDLEKQVLHFAQRSAVGGGREFFHGASDLWFALAEEPRNEIQIALSREDLPFGGDGSFEIQNALIGLLQPNGFGGLRAAECIEVSRLEAGREGDLIGIDTLAHRPRRRFRRLKDGFPALVFPLKPRSQHVHLLFVS